MVQILPEKNQVFFMEYCADIVRKKNIRFFSIEDFFYNILLSGYSEYTIIEIKSIVFFYAYTFNMLLECIPLHIESE